MDRVDHLELSEVVFVTNVTFRTMRSSSNKPERLTWGKKQERGTNIDTTHLRLARNEVGELVVEATDKLGALHKIPWHLVKSYRTRDDAPHKGGSRRMAR